MELTGSYDLHGTKSAVWEALHSPDCLRRIIPGCIEISRSGDTAYSAKIITRVGPLKVNFTGEVNYTDLKPIDSFRIDGNGKGGPAGFAKGAVDIDLESRDVGMTRLTYRAQTSLGGKIASLGSRLLEAISHRNIDQFFAGLQQELDAHSQNGVTGSADAPAQAIQPAPRESILPLINTILLAAIAAALWIIAMS